MIKILDLIFLSRPVLWIPVWGFSVFGYVCGLTRVAPYHIGTIAQQGIALFWMIVFSASVGAVYIMNQIADRRVDEANPGFPLLVKSGISNGAAWAAAGAPALAALIAPLAAGRPMLAACSAGALIIGALYSFRPFSLSGRPVVDFAANAVGYGVVAFGAGWIISGAPMSGASFCRAAAPYVLLMCAGSISSTLPDYAGDTACGKRTTAVALGTYPAHTLALLFLFCALGCSWWARDRVAMICAAIAAPVYIAYSLYRSKQLMEATYKAGGGACMIVAAALFPLLIPAALATALATWLYFRYHHGVNYPSLMPAGQRSAEHAGEN